MTASTSFVCSRSFLLVVIFLQWIVVTLLLFQGTHHPVDKHPSHVDRHPSSLAAGVSAWTTPRSCTTTTTTTTTTNEDHVQLSAHKYENANSTAAAAIMPPPSSLPGVGVTLFFRSPQWFHLRYTHLLHNAALHLPPGWGLQIMVNPSWFLGEQARVLHWHPGLRRLLALEEEASPSKQPPAATADAAFSSHPRRHMTEYRGTFLGRHVYVTWLPDVLTKPPAKPKGVLHSRWIWQEIVAERVLLYSGNGVFCGNHLLAAAERPHPSSTSLWQAWGWTDEASRDSDASTSSSDPTTRNHDDSYYLDYVGTPWKQMGGVGGDGSSHSYRNRTSMLRILEWAKDDDSWIKQAEHVWLLHAMQRYNKEHAATANDGQGTDLFRIATPAQTFVLGGVTNLSHDGVLQRVPYVAAGTHAHVTWGERESLLKHCPELKTIFPSLHEPACFGARPKPDICRQTICAMQDPLPKSGC
jgi:hypothetical protein